MFTKDNLRLTVEYNFFYKKQNIIINTISLNKTFFTLKPEIKLMLTCIKCVFSFTLENGL